jgi:ssDNA-binding Zn-finger/Zn-ribbon topoisomerase 1
VAAKGASLPERKEAEQIAQEKTPVAGELALAEGRLCQSCGSPMRHRTKSKSPGRGTYFMSCSAYPHCRTARPLNERELAMWGRCYSERPGPR